MVLFSGSKAAPSQSTRGKAAAVNGGGAVSAKGLSLAKGGATTSVAMASAASTNTPKTNPISQLYEIGDQIGTGGLGMMWKVFNATKLDTKEVSTA